MGNTSFTRIWRKKEAVDPYFEIIIIIIIYKDSFV